MGKTVKRAGAPARKNGFPTGFRKLSPLAKMRWLKSGQAKTLVSSGALPYSAIETAVKTLTRQSKQIARIVATPALLDEYQNGGKFPPPSENTPMVRATLLLNRKAESSVYWPASYVSEAGATFDYILFRTWCSQQEMRGPRDDVSDDRSRSAVAIGKLEEAGGIVTERKLLTEDAGVLRDQLQRYLAGKPTSLLKDDSRVV